MLYVVGLIYLMLTFPLSQVWKVGLLMQRDVKFFDDDDQSDTLSPQFMLLYVTL